MSIHCLQFIYFFILVGPLLKGTFLIFSFGECKQNVFSIYNELGFICIWTLYHEDTHVDTGRT